MVDLGIPQAPLPTLAPRRKTKQLKLGNVLVGGDAPVSVQSMCTTVTADVNSTLQQIAELTNAELAVAKTLKGLIRTFKFNDSVAKKGDNARTHAGVIAQDVQEVFPVAVRERTDGTLAVDYEKLSAIAFAAIKEQQKQIDELKQLINQE
mgnify:CR=1 FL=1